jgi:two-component system LytT family response regulator
MRVLVVDDEPPARRRLLSLLSAEADVTATEARDGLEAVEALREDPPDLVLLDVQMPGMSGFDVIDAIGAEAMPPVVFVTAYDEHALRAFEVHAVDYVLKPVVEERLRKALTRARERIGAKDERLAPLLSSVRGEGGGERLSRLVVKKGEKLRLVPVGEVVYLSASGNYVDVHVAGGETYLLRETLTRLEGRLDPARFARIHRGEIVNVDFVKELEPWFHGDWEVVLKDGRRLRLSRRYQDRLLADR